MTQTTTQTSGPATDAIVEPKPPSKNALRRLTDGLYRVITRATSFTDPATPRAEPTESQKFRGNLLITFVGSVVFVYGMQIIGDLAKQSQIAAERSNAQLQFFHDELKHFSETMPRVILKTYQMNLALANFKQATATPPAATAAPAVSPDTFYADFRKLQDELTNLPNGEALCHQLALYLQDRTAMESVENLRLAYGKLFDADSFDQIRSALQETNAAWDKAMASIGREGQRLREDSGASIRSR